MLKQLFGSNSRVKILSKLYEDPDRPYFVRELTRALDEQINSIRRELISLKKIGLLHSKSKNRKKYFSLNKNFILYPDLRNIFHKTASKNNEACNIIASTGTVDLLILAGVFIGDNEAKIDLLVVGEVDKDKLKKLIISEFNYKRDLSYAVLSRENFLERINFKDKFIMNLLQSADSIIEINNMNDEIRHILEKK